MIEKSERRWAWKYAVVVMVLTTVPYMLGYAAQGENWAFSGFIFGVEDGNSYIAKMLSGAAGVWIFRTPYTAMPQSGVFAFTPYLLLGKLSAPPGQHEQLVALFHLFRFAAGVLAIVATYDFLAIYLRSILWRRWGTVLATLGGGLGWIVLLLGRQTWLGSLPLEFYSPETFGFLALYGLPHLAMARALLLWGLRAYLTPGEGAYTNAIYAGLLWLLMGVFQPLTVVVAWTVVGAHWVGELIYHRVRRQEAPWKGGWEIGRSFKRASLAVGVSAPIVFYTFVAFNLNPFTRSWTEQNLIPSPHPAHYLLAYGLLIPFSILGALVLLRNGDSWGSLLPVTWVIILPLLAYAPYNLQRRLPEGGWVALVVLVMVYLERRPGSRPPRRAIIVPVDYDQRTSRTGAAPLRAAALPLILLFPSTLLLVAGGIGSALSPHQPLFLPRDQVVAFELLSEYEVPGDVVLSGFDTGNALPAYAPVRVVIGHGPESVGLELLRPRVAEFYGPMSPQARRAFLAEFNVAFVFWGPEERKLGKWRPGQESFLSLAVDVGGFQVYRVSGID